MPKAKNQRAPREVILREVPAIEVPEDANEELFDDVEAARAENAPLASLLASLGEAGGDAKVIVQRVSTTGGRRVEEWLFEGSPSETLQSDIQATYGPGEYRIRIYQPAVHPETGKRYMDCLANKAIHIGPARAPAAGAAAAVSPATPDLTALFREAINATNERLLSVLTPLLASNANRGSAIDDLKGLAEAIGIAAPARAAQPEPERMFAAFAGMMKMMRDLQPEKSAIPESGDVSENALLLRGIDAFMEAMRAARGASLPSPDAPVLTAPALSTAQAIPAPAPQTAVDEEEPEVQMLKIFLKSLLKGAAQNAPVESYAEKIANLAGDDVLDKLEGDAWFTELCALLPEAARFPEWFARVRAAVLVLIAEDQPPADGHSPTAPSASH